MGKKKNQRKKRQDDDWPEDDDVPTLDTKMADAEDAQPAARGGKKSRRKAKNKQAADDDDDVPTKALSGLSVEDDDNDDDMGDDMLAMAVAAQSKKKGKKNKKNRQRVPDADKEEAEEEEDEPTPPPQDDQDMDQDDPYAAAAAAPRGKKKKGKKGKKGGFAGLAVDDDADALVEEDAVVDEPDQEPDAEQPDEEEDVLAVAPAKSSKKKKHRIAFDAGDDDDEAEAEAKAEAEVEDEDEDDEDGGARNHKPLEIKPEEDGDPEADVDADDVGDLGLSDKPKKPRAKKPSKSGDDGEPVLSRKERKKLAKQEAARAQMAAMEAEGNFTIAFRANADEEFQEGTKDIKLEAFSISARGQDLFVDAELKISHGRRYGLVGPNGHGKSTLLQHLAERKIPFPSNIDCLLCEQEVETDGKTTAMEAVLNADTERLRLLEEQEKFTKLIDEEEDEKKQQALQKELNKVYEGLTAIGADAAEGRARRILAGLGFTTEMQDRVTKHFSGGWRMRISLARALFIEPTLLLLDEPTNHLDLNAVIWLDNYLSRWKKTLLIVSHDQDFLDNVCTDIVHLDQKKLVYYKGNYSAFKSMYKQKLVQEKKQFEQQAKELKRLKRSGMSKKQAEEAASKHQGQKQQGKGAKGKGKGKKSQQREDDSGTTAQAPKLLSRPKEYVVNFTFPNPPDLSPPVLGVHDVKFRYNSETDWIFKNVDMGIDMQSRISIVGNNGAGKSTLLKLLSGEATATEGEVRKNPRARIGLFNQHAADQLNGDESPVEHLQRLFNLDYQAARKTLGRFGLAGHGHTIKMKDLSGGQKARVVFAELSLREPDILILDEPTNNLDLESIDALVQAVLEFSGGVVVVSHDARLITECECELWEVADGTCKQFDGDFEDYKEAVLERLEDPEVVEVEGRRVDAADA